MTEIENTSKRDPAAHLIGMLANGQSHYIEGMEAAGQRRVAIFYKAAFYDRRADMHIVRDDTDA